MTERHTGASMTDTALRFDLAAYDDVFLVRDTVTGLLRRAGTYAEVVATVAEYNSDPRLAELSQSIVNGAWRMGGREAVKR